MCAVIRFIRVYVASIRIRIVFRTFIETRNQQWWKKEAWSRTGLLCGDPPADGGGGGGEGEVEVGQEEESNTHLQQKGKHIRL